MATATDTSKDETVAEVIVVSSAAELSEALSSASGGDIIELAAGDYGDFSFKGGVYSSDVTIRPADADNPPVFNTLSLSGVENIALEGITVDFTPTDDTVAWSPAVNISDSSGVSLTGADLIGGPAINGSPEDAEPGDTDPSGNIIGRPTGRGISIRESSDITIADSQITTFHKGIVLGGVTGLTVSNNEISDLRTSPVTGVVLDDAVFEGNYFHSSNPWKHGGAGDHADYIHLWTDPDHPDSPVENIIVRDNVFAEGDGVSLVGVYLDDNNRGIGFEDVVIENNVMHIGHIQGIRIENGDGVAIRQNSLVQSSGAVNDAPGTILTDGTRNAVVENNVMGRLVIDDEADKASITAGNNLFVQSADPSAADHTSNFLVGSAGVAFTPLDSFALRPDVAAAEGLSDIGAIAFDTTPDSLTARITGDTFLGTAEAASAAFDAALSAGPKGYVDADSATFNWDFGDGSTANGMAVEHTYAEEGTYLVTLTVDTGTATDTRQYEVRVENPFILGMDAVTNAADSVAGVSVNPDGNPAGDGPSTVFDGASHVNLGRPDAFSNFEELFIGFDVRLDADAGNEVRLFWNHGRFTVELSGDDVVFSWYTSDGGRHKLTLEDSELRNGDWHSLSLSFDGGADRLEAFVNGESIGVADGVTGDIASPNNDVWLGGTPWGRHLDGEIANVQAFTAPQPVTMPSKPQTTSSEPVSAPPVFDSDVLMGEADMIGLATATDDTLVFGGEGYADFGALKGMGTTGELAVSFQMRTDTAPDSTARVLWNHSRFGVEAKGDDLVFRLFTDSGDSVYAKAKDVLPPDSQWHTVAFTYDAGAGSFKAFVDGVRVVSETGLSGLVEAPAYDLWSGGTPWGRDYDGEMRDIRVWDDLESADITTMTKDDGGDLVAGILDDAAYFLLPDAVTLEAENFVGNVTISDQVIGFDGDSHINLESPDVLMEMDAVSAFVEVRPDGEIADRARVLWSHGRYGIELKGDEARVYLFTDTGESHVMTLDGLPTGDGNWHELGFTYSKETGTLTGYLDGKALQTIDGISGGIDASNDWPVMVGGAFGHDFKGDIADLYIANSAITPDPDWQSVTTQVADGSMTAPADPYDPSEYWNDDPSILVHI